MSEAFSKADRFEWAMVPLGGKHSPKAERLGTTTIDKCAAKSMAGANDGERE